MRSPLKKRLYRPVSDRDCDFILTLVEQAGTPLTQLQIGEAAFLSDLANRPKTKQTREWYRWTSCRCGMLVVCNYLLRETWPITRARGRQYAWVYSLTRDGEAWLQNYRKRNT